MADVTPTSDTQGMAAPARAPLTILTKRSDFLRAARARRQGVTGLHLQARRRSQNEADGIRVGFTCSKKVGNAVARNRAKRRLREVARQVLPALGRDGWDYVLIGKAGATAERPFDRLLEDLQQALEALHRERSEDRTRPGRQ